MNYFRLLLFVCFTYTSESYSFGYTSADSLIAHTYYAQGDSLYKIGGYTEAIMIYDSAATKFKLLKDDYNFVLALLKKYICMRELGLYNAMLEQIHGTIQLAKDRLGSNSLPLAYLYHNTGVVKRIHGHYEESEDYLNKALIIKRQHLGPRHPDVFSEYNSLAGLYYSLGNYDKTAYTLRKLIGYIPNDLEYLPTKANAHKNLAHTYIEMGELDSALHHNLMALDIRRDIYPSSHPSLATAYNGIGLTFLYKGYNHAAMDYFQQSLRTAAKTLPEKHQLVGHIYLNLGFANQNLGNYDKALEYTMKSLLIRKFVVNNNVKSGIDLIYNNFGVIYYNIGELDSAEKYLKLAINAADQPNSALAESVNYLAKIYLKEGQIDKSIEAYNNGIKYLNHIQTWPHPYEVHLRNNLARVKFMIGNMHEAIDLYISAIRHNLGSGTFTHINNKTPSNYYLDLDELLISKLGLAKCYEKLYNANNDESLLKNSVEFYNACDTIIDQLNNVYLNYQDKLEFLKNTSETYSGGIDAVFNLAKKINQPNLFKQAYRLSEKSKGKALTSLYTTKYAQHNSNIPAELLEIININKIDRVYYTNRINDEIGKATNYDSVKVHKMQDVLFQKSREYDSVLSYMEKKFPRYHAIKYSTKYLSVDELQKRIHPDQAILEYFVGKEHVYVFLITTQQFFVDRVKFGIDEIMDIERLRKLITSQVFSDSNSVVEIHSLSLALYQKYLAPFIEHMETGITELTIIPDGQFNYLPFELLLTKDPYIIQDGSKDLVYLIKEFSIQYGYSASLLFGAGSPQNTSPSKGLIAFAPSYPSKSHGLAGNTKFGRFRDQISGLKWNGPEIIKIQNHIGGELFAGPDATEHVFKSKVQEFNVIHLAMHALVDDEDPMNSKLVFTQKKDSLEDNMLHAYELYNMNIPANLAVLSACETGYGKMAKGEGVMSLARAFSYAGCPSVVMSHWSVNDAATAKLMGYFYKYLADGQEKHVALRNAKLEFLEQADPAQAHPYFWGGFVLVGDARPLELGEKWTWLFYLLVSIPMVGLVYILINWKTKK